MHLQICSRLTTMAAGATTSRQASVAFDDTKVSCDTMLINAVFSFCSASYLLLFSITLLYFQPPFWNLPNELTIKIW